METQFIRLQEKLDLIKLLETGNEEAINFAITEISRLESIIRNYEGLLQQAVRHLGSPTFKTPQQLPITKK